MLWEIEVGEPYSLSRKNDIFSGLGEKDGGRQTQVQSQETKTEEQKKVPAEQEEQEGEEEEFVRVEELLDSIEEETETEAMTGDADEKKPSGSAEPPPPPRSDEKEEELLAQELKRAECIVETFRDVKVSVPSSGCYPDEKLSLSRSFLWWGPPQTPSRRVSTTLSSMQSLSLLALLSSFKLHSRTQSFALLPPLPPLRVWW